MEKKLCQSCGMPLDEPALYGTEADGSSNEEYCKFCYSDGKFTSDVTMDGMIDHCVKYLDEFNGVSGTPLSAREAREQMCALFPTLNRWRK